jgi:HK97 family phage portal protein
MSEQVTALRKVGSERLSAEAAELLKAAIDHQIEGARKDFNVTLSGFHQLFDKSLWGSGDAAKPTQPYRQVELVYTCINKLIFGVAGLELVLSTLDEDIVESGPMYDVLFNNPLMSFERFIVETVGHYVLNCDVFWVFTDMQGRRPKEIAVVSGKQMKAVTDTGRKDGVLIGWEFCGAGGQRQRYALDEAWQWKNFNPYDHFHGVGPLEAAKMSMNYSYGATLFNSAALANGAEPGIILSTPNPVTPEQADYLRKNFDARHAGAGKAKRTAILTGGMDAKTVAMNMVDMDVSTLTDKSDRKISSAFGVPPGVSGLVTEAQYSQGPAQRDFIFNTILPLASLLAGEITRGILEPFYGSDVRGVPLAKSQYYGGPRYKALGQRAEFRKAKTKAVQSKQRIFAWFDSSSHPVVQEHQQEVAEKVLKFTEAGATFNNLVEAHDLPYETQPWGDDWWIGMGQVPARFTLDAGLEGITGPSLPEGDDGTEPEASGQGAAFSTIDEFKKQQAEAEAEAQKADEQQRLRLWQNWVISWAGIEREYKESLRVFFVRQQRLLVAKLKKALAELKGQQKADAEQVIARVVFDLALEDTGIKVINKTFFEKATELGIRQSFAELLDLSGEALDVAVEQAKRLRIVKGSLTRSSFNITKINRTTQEMVARQLRDGVEAGEGLNDLTERVKKTLGSRRAQALRIARTQTGGAVNCGRHAGMEAGGAKLKAWITSGDDHVRDSHRRCCEHHKEAGSRYASGIPLEVPFIVNGSSLNYPGDPAGSSAEIINCRCLSIPRKAGA